MEPIRLMIVDDREVVRLGLSAVVEPVDDIEVVGCFGDAEEAVIVYFQVLPYLRHSRERGNPEAYRSHTSVSRRIGLMNRQVRSELEVFHVPLQSQENAIPGYGVGLALRRSLVDASFQSTHAPGLPSPFRESAPQARLNHNWGCTYPRSRRTLQPSAGRSSDPLRRLA